MCTNNYNKIHIKICVLQGKVTAIYVTGPMLKTFTGKQMEKPYCYAKEQLGIEESTPRVTSRQHHCQNISSNNSSDYYKCTTTIPYLTTLISELNARFDVNSSKIVSEFMLLLPQT